MAQINYPARCRSAFLSLLILCVLVNASAAESPLLDPFPVLRHGVCAKSIAMGGTGVVNSTGAEAILWNPACIITGDRLSFILYGNMVTNSAVSNIPDANYFFSGMIIKLTDREWLIFERPTIGAGFFFYSMSGLSVIGVDPVSANPMITDFNNESANDILFIVPFATDMIYSERKLSIGVNLLLHRHSLFNIDSDNSTGIDLGARWSVIGENYPAGNLEENKYASGFFLTLGARIRHIHRIKWQGSYDQQSYTQNDWRYFDLGMSIGSNIIDSDFFKGITVSPQFRIDENRDYHLSVGTEISLNMVRLRFGAENIVTSYSSDYQANSSLNFGLGLARLSNMQSIKGLHLDFYYKMFTGNNTWMENETGLSLGYFL